MTDLTFQNLSTVQSDKNLLPPTIASAATVAPVHFLTFLTGTAQLATITPPVTGCHMLCFIFTNASPGAFVTTGNIQAAYTPIQNQATFVIYDPSTKKYWRVAVT